MNKVLQDSVDMETIQKMVRHALSILLVCATWSLSLPILACTRVLYQGPAGRVLTGRTMDWKLEILSNLWIFPRGMKRHGAAGPNSLT
ncbi:linear amide C-N hydrolase [Leptothermofonsia sp. ETS-13]|uniref:linear amide C-N hydrolase n=1 Tax=Leptothermofonsia sp. ETS-13 TaxID=3035696 RepID=UPI003BA37BE3